MKTALDLLGPNTTACACRMEFGYICSHEAELVAQRAREEMREMAAGKAIAMLAAFGDAHCDRCRASDDVADEIRKLPVTP